MRIPKFMKSKWFNGLLDAIIAPIAFFMIIIPLYMVLTGAATAVILAPIKFVVWMFGG